MPDLVLTSDVIIGFPGETEAEAMETGGAGAAGGVRRPVHLYLLSRPGTPAAKMDDPVPRAKKQVWFDRLCDTQNENFRAAARGLWAGPCVCWSTGRRTTAGGLSPPGRTGDGWSTSRGIRP